MHFDCVDGFLNSIKEIIWQTEAIYHYPLSASVCAGEQKKKKKQEYQNA